MRVPSRLYNDIHVERRGDEIYLRGQVDTFYMKQLAQERRFERQRVALQLVNAVFCRRVAIFCVRPGNANEEVVQRRPHRFEVFDVAAQWIGS